MNNKGQSIVSEYVMIFFVVIAAVAAMTTYVQRGLQARVHDVRNFMVNSVNAACDADCAQATGNVLAEYEPYYSQTASDTVHNEEQNTGLAPGNSQVIGMIYTNTVSDNSATISISNQLPACASANPVPSWCGK